MMNETNRNELANVPAGFSEVAVDAVSAETGIERLTGAGNGTRFLSSIVDDGSRESKVKIYNAINKAENKIDDCKGEVIEMVDFVAHPVSLVADDSGEMVQCTRVVLIDKHGAGYETVASGVISSLEKIFSIVGFPPYKDEPLKVIPREQKTRKGYKTLTLDLA